MSDVERRDDSCLPSKESTSPLMSKDGAVGSAASKPRTLSPIDGLPPPDDRSPVVVKAISDLVKHHFWMQVANLEHLCQLLEEAHWDYLDLYHRKHASIYSDWSLQQFTSAVYAFHGKEYPFINFTSSPEGMIKWYRSIKVPSFGAILLSADEAKCVMVRSVQGKRWGLPKGKQKYIVERRVKKNDEDTMEWTESSAPVKEGGLECAAREVKEELGVDVFDRLDESLKISLTQGGKTFTYYVVFGLDEETPFAPLLRNEIEEIAWRNISTLSSGHFRPVYTQLRRIIDDRHCHGHETLSDGSVTQLVEVDWPETPLLTFLKTRFSRYRAQIRPPLVDEVTEGGDYVKLSRLIMLEGLQSYAPYLEESDS